MFVDKKVWKNLTLFNQPLPFNRLTIYRIHLFPLQFYLTACD